MNVLSIRRTVLPEEIFSLIERYMMGELDALYVVATDGKEVFQASAGSVPSFIACNDSDVNHIRRKK